MELRGGDRQPEDSEDYPFAPSSWNRATGRTKKTESWTAAKAMEWRRTPLAPDRGPSESMSRPLHLRSSAIGLGNQSVWLVTTFSGSGSAGHVDGSKADARFLHPEYAAIDPQNGCLFVSEPLNRNARIVFPDGSVQSILAKRAECLFNDRRRWRGLTRRWRGKEEAEEQEIAAGAGEQGLRTRDAIGGAPLPYAALPHSEGRCIYLADATHHNVLKIDAKGVHQYAGNGLAEDPMRKDGPREAARFQFPRFLGMDAKSNLYVGDAFYDSIRKILPNGQVISHRKPPKVLGDGRDDERVRVHHFGGMAVRRRDGTIYLTTRMWDHSVYRLDPEGGDAITRIAGGSVAGHRDGPGSVAMFAAPHGIKIHPKDERELWVADRHNFAVRRLRLLDDGGCEVTTVAGTGMWGYQDGLASVASFSEVHDVCFTLDGQGAYITDTDSHVIRKLSRIPSSEARQHLAKITVPPTQEPTQAPSYPKFTLLETHSQRQGREQLERLGDALEGKSEQTWNLSRSAYGIDASYIDLIAPKPVHEERTRSAEETGQGHGQAAAAGDDRNAGRRFHIEAPPRLVNEEEEKKRRLERIDRYVDEYFRRSDVRASPADVVDPSSLPRLGALNTSTCGEEEEEGEEEGEDEAEGGDEEGLPCNEGGRSSAPGSSSSSCQDQDEEEEEDEDEDEDEGGYVVTNANDARHFERMLKRWKRAAKRREKERRGGKLERGGREGGLFNSSSNLFNSIGGGRKREGREEERDREGVKEKRKEEEKGTPPLGVPPRRHASHSTVEQGQQALDEGLSPQALLLDQLEEDLKTQPRQENGAPRILSLDLMRKHGLVLDFEPRKIRYHRGPPTPFPTPEPLVWRDTRKKFYSTDAEESEEAISQPEKAKANRTSATVGASLEGGRGGGGRRRRTKERDEVSNCEVSSYELDTEEKRDRETIAENIAKHLEQNPDRGKNIEQELLELNDPVDRFRNAFYEGGEELTVVNGIPRKLELTQGFREGYYQFGAVYNRTGNRNNGTEGRIEKGEGNTTAAAAPDPCAKLGSKEVLPYRSGYPTKRTFVSPMVATAARINSIDAELGWIVDIDSDGCERNVGRDEDEDGKGEEKGERNRTQQTILDAASHPTRNKDDDLLSLAAAKEARQQSTETNDLTEMEKIRRDNLRILSQEDGERILEGLNTETSDSGVEALLEERCRAGGPFDFQRWLRLLPEQSRDLFLDYLQGETPTLDDLLMLDKESIANEVGHSADLDTLWKYIALATKHKRDLRSYRHKKALRRAHKPPKPLRALVGHRMGAV